MFSDKSYPPVSIPSYWKTLKTSGESSTQTSDCVGVDKNDQTSETRNTEVQTDNSTVPISASNVDEKALASFLNKISPKIIQELDKASKSKAFLSYQLPDEDSSQEVKIICNLTKSKNKVDDMKVNSLTWSCTGSVVVLGLGFSNHDDWCSHSGFIQFYNINRSSSVSIAPSKVLEATSCVTSVATHPYEPSVLASGLYRGSVILWNLQREGAECVAVVNGHNDPVSQIIWVSMASVRPLIVSAGLDGQLNVWNASHSYDSIDLKDSYVLTNSDSSLEAGITCFSFLNSRPSVFVAALEGGKIFHCCLNTSKTATKVGCSTHLKNPVVGELGGHKGLVTCLSFSPYHEDLFLSAGTDQEIHVRSIFEVEPLKVIWCETEVLGVAWSPSQANIFMSWGQSADISVYDSLKGCKLTSFKMNDVPSLCASAFNWKSPKLLAVGDNNGKAYVWQIPQYFKTGH